MVGVKARGWSKEERRISQHSYKGRREDLLWTPDSQISTVGLNHFAVVAYWLVYYVGVVGSLTLYTILQGRYRYR